MDVCFGNKGLLQLDSIKMEDITYLDNVRMFQKRKPFDFPQGRKIQARRTRNLFNLLQCIELVGDSVAHKMNHSICSLSEFLELFVAQFMMHAVIFVFSRQ